MDLVKLVPAEALPTLAAGGSNVVIAIAFVVLWRRYRKSHLLAFGLSYGSLGIVVLLLALEHAMGRFSWRDYFNDGAFIGAALLLLAGCWELAGRTAPVRSLAVGAVLAYVAAEIGLLTLGFEPRNYLPEAAALLYLWIAYLFLSRQDLSGNRFLGTLFALRGLVNLPWYWEFRHDLVALSAVIDQILFAGIGWALVLTDFFRTADQNAELNRALAQREARIRSLVDANVVGILMGSFDGRVLEANDEFLRSVGYDRDDLAAGRINWMDLTPPDWRERDKAWVEEHRRTGIRTPIEKQYFHKNGGRVPVLIAASTNEEGGSEFVGIVLDLTELKRAEAAALESAQALRETERQLARANRIQTLGQLTASIAHEVNLPIAAAVTNAQAALRRLAKEPPDLEEAREALHSTVRDGRRAGDVVHRIRNLTKKAPMAIDRVEIRDVIREVAEFVRSEATKNGIRVQADLSEGLPAVRGDRVQLQQVFLNLAINAIEAMASGDEPRNLLIAAARHGLSNVIVSVSDSGPGLSPAVQENLFKAFHTTKADGLGLGLSICRAIVEAHGGSIRATLNVPRGAQFQVTLPCDPVDASFGDPSG